MRGTRRRGARADRAGELLRALLQALVERARPGRPYAVHASVGVRSLLEVLVARGAMALRGYLRRPWLGRASGLLFVGRGVAIRHGHLVRLGRGVLLEDHVFIDALGEWGVRLGDHVTIGRGTAIKGSAVLWNPGKGLVMGEGSAVGDYSFLGAAGGIVIGANVLCGARVSLHSENHRYDDPARPIREQGVTREGIEIGDDCWLGGGAIVLDGVRIGRGSVIAAGSVVTRSVPPGSVAAGVPARVIGARGRGSSRP